MNKVLNAFIVVVMNMPVPPTHCFTKQTGQQDAQDLGL